MTEYDENIFINKDHIKKRFEFNDHPSYIAPGQGQTTPWGQNFDVKRKTLSLCPFVASVKKSL